MRNKAAISFHTVPELLWSWALFCRRNSYSPLAQNVATWMTNDRHSQTKSVKDPQEQPRNQRVFTGSNTNTTRSPEKTLRDQTQVQIKKDLHATAGWNLAPVSEPGDLWLGKAANAWCWDNGTLSLRDWLGSFTLLKTAHNYRKTNKQYTQKNRRD